MKKIELIIICLIYQVTNAQVPELVQNGSFTTECGNAFDQPPCGWNYRQGSGSDDIAWDIPVHVGRGNLNGYYYTSLGTCNTLSITGCNGRAVTTARDNDCPPLSITPNGLNTFGDPIFAPISSSCATSNTVFDYSNGNIPNNRHCMFLPPGFGAFNRGGIETNVGTLCAGDYKLSFDVMIMLPAENSGFALKAFLNNEQDNKDKEVFELSNSVGSTMTSGVWRHFEVNITIDENDDHNFEWLSFVNERCNIALEAGPVHSVFLDNVSFYSKCTNSLGACSPYLGKADPIFVTQGTENICVINLGNVESFKLEIFDGDSKLIRTIEIQDPAEQICWDQKTGAGVTVSSGPYLARVTGSSGCCSFNKSFNFVRTSNQNTNNSLGLNYSPQQKLNKTNCCNPDIIIENETISDMRQYIGPGKIRIGPNVNIQNTADVYLQAGVNIEIVEPLEIEAGAIFEATIQDCSPPMFKVSPHTIAKNDSILPLEGVDHAKLDNWYLMPNPARDNISVNLSLMSLQYPNVYLTMYDYTGKEVVTQKIHKSDSKYSFDISGLSIGLYYISLKQNGQVLSTKKFLKQ